MLDKNNYTVDINNAVSILKNGGVILYPTDTVWGIGCDATNSDAVRKIFEIKRRSDSKALITLVPDIDSLWRVVDNVPDAAQQLIDASVRPVTIVYDKGVGVAPEVLAPDGSIGVRVTAECFSNSLCRALKRPLISTSANISGSPTPKAFCDISKEIINSVDYVCTSRRNETNGKNKKPSLVIKISDSGVFKILRS